jgi:predicted small lipoprotein YifL
MVALALVVLLAGCGSRGPSLPDATTTPATDVPPTPGAAGGDARASPIAAENLLLGTTAWQILRPGARAIDGFVTPFGITAGASGQLFVNTTRDAFHVEVYRLGWYAGKGGRLVESLGPFRGQRQPDPSIDPATGQALFNWTPTLRLETAANWTTGVYVAKLVADGGSEQYAPFVVRARAPHAPILYHTNEFTWQAYNREGGTSLYRSAVPGLSVAHAVGLDRPYDSNNGWGDLGRWELPMIRFMEARGADVDYATDADVDADPSLLLAHHGIVSAGHDEYWTMAMRRNLEAARDAGIHEAFLGANTGYWRVRLTDNDVGPGRAMVSYKADYAKDPMYVGDRANVTGRFRDPYINVTGVTLLGSEYASDTLIVNASGGSARTLYDMAFTANATAIFRGAVEVGEVARGIVGYEWDYLPANDSPTGIHVVGMARPVSSKGEAWDQDAVVYRAPSGAVVFNAGTISWPLGLEEWRNDARGQSAPSRAVRAITADLLDLMAGDAAAVQVPDVYDPAAMQP